MVFNSSVVYVQVVTLVSHLHTLHIWWHVPNTCNIMCPPPQVSVLSVAAISFHASKSLKYFWISYLQVGMNCSRKRHISYQLTGSCMRVEGKISVEVPILYRMGTDFLKYAVKRLVLKSFFF